MAISQDQIVRQCFDGERRRDCSYCPAHYSKGGTCCFGHRFEYDDEQCLSCCHNHACEPLTHDLQERQVERPRRPSIPARRRLSIYGQQGRQDKGNLLGDQPAAREERDADQEIIAYLPRQRKGEGKWKHFFRGLGLIGAWGAGEGALELILNYLRRRRPE
jgi:hypothetical protein